MPNVEDRRKEFFKNIWNHANDPFQAQFDERRPLTKDELGFLEKIVALIHEFNDDDDLGREIFKKINKDPDNLLLILQLCGVTRSKIITDLTAAAASIKPSPKIPGKYAGVARNEEVWKFAGPYLAKWVRKVLGVLTTENLSLAAEALNQATWSGFIRQERAKRSGHEGEYRLATLLATCEIPFVPIEKADNPLCPDVQINGVSFDIVVPNIEAPVMCVKATVHTSNIGQFGESKVHLEVSEAKQMLDEHFEGDERPCLLALIDGVGFTSNQAGLNGVLEKADEFCQYRTLWKAAVIAASLTEIPLRLELPQEIIDEYEEFLNHYNFMDSVVAKEANTEAQHRFPVGDGFILSDQLPSE